MELLASCGWAGTVGRLTALCECVVNNGFVSWPQLGFADDPSTWEDSAYLEEDDMQFIRDFTKKGLSVPKYVASLVSCNDLCCVFWENAESCAQARARSQASEWASRGADVPGGRKRRGTRTWSHGCGCKVQVG